MYTMCLLRTWFLFIRCVNVHVAFVRVFPFLLGAEPHSCLSVWVCWCVCLHFYTVRPRRCIVCVCAFVCVYVVCSPVVSIPVCNDTFLWCFGFSSLRTCWENQCAASYVWVHIIKDGDCWAIVYCFFYLSTGWCDVNNDFIVIPSNHLDRFLTDSCEEWRGLTLSDRH